MTVSTVSRKAADAFADSVGEDRSKVRVADPQWKSMLTQCVMLEVHCSGWPAETRGTLADVGIHPADDAEAKAYAGVLDIGKLALLPKRIIKKAQSQRNRYRMALYERTIPSHWGRLLPGKNYNAWKAEATQLEGDYEDFAMDVYERWDVLIGEQRMHLTTIGLRNYRLLMQAGRKPAEEASVWVANFVDRIMRKAVTREEWLHSMKLSHDDPAYIPLASMLAEDETEAARVMAIAQAKTEMQRDVLQAASKQFETGLFTFMADARSAVSNLILEVTDDCLTNLRKNKNVLPRNSSKQLKNLIEKIEGLQFWDDAKLSAQMSEIKLLLAKPSKARDGKAFESVLADVEREARLVLNSLNRPIEGKAQRHTSEAVDEIDLPKVRQARKVAEFDDTVAPVANRQGRKTGTVI